MTTLNKTKKKKNPSFHDEYTQDTHKGLKLILGMVVFLYFCFSSLLIFYFLGLPSSVKRFGKARGQNWNVVQLFVELNRLFRNNPGKGEHRVLFQRNASQSGNQPRLPSRCNGKQHDEKPKRNLCWLVPTSSIPPVRFRFESPIEMPTRVGNAFLNTWTAGQEVSQSNVIQQNSHYQASRSPERVCQVCWWAEQMASPTSE